MSATELKTIFMPFLRLMPFLSLIHRHGLRGTVILISVFVTLTLASYHLFQAQSDHNSFIKRLDYLFYDWRYNLFLDDDRFPRADEKIIIVDIDEKSLAKEGRWPWPRDKIATLVENLAAAGTVVIGFDILMTEPQVNPTRSLQHQAILKGRPDLAKQLESFLPDTEYDAILANSFSQTDIVLSFLFQDDATIKIGQLPAPIYRLQSDQPSRLLAIRANGFTANVPILQQAATGAGFIVSSIDGDGVLRSAPMVQLYQQQLYPSLSLAMGMAYMVIDQTDISIRSFSADFDMISKFNFVDQQIYTDFKARVLVPYLGPRGEFPYVSASDIVRNSFNPEQFNNALVLVGTSSVGLADLRNTPVGTQFPGVEVHANLLNGLLKGTFPVEIVESNTIAALILLLLGLSFTFYSSRLGPFQLTIATIALLIGLVSFNLYFWFQQNISLPLASSFLLTLALGTLHLLEGFLSERRAKQHVTSVFGQYVPSAHISHMLSEPTKYGFEGETREMTVLFSDVRSFTTISENLTATQLKDLLNRYFTPITESIFNHQGTIDKYVGDMVMAFWGAPLVDPHHALHALESAVDMLNILEHLNPQLAALGYPEIKVGIGLNTGLMNVGDMGSSFRKAYTVLGDSVNLGSRLESLTKYYGTNILVGPETKNQCPGWVFRFIDKILVRGKKVSVDVYEPLAPIEQLASHWPAELALFDSAYEAYLQQDWDRATVLFTELLFKSAQASVYAVYLKRIESIRAEPLPPDWDGTFLHTD